MIQKKVPLNQPIFCKKIFSKINGREISYSIGQKGTFKSPDSICCAPGFLGFISSPCHILPPKNPLHFVKGGDHWKWWGSFHFATSLKLRGASAKGFVEHGFVRMRAQIPCGAGRRCRSVLDPALPRDDEHLEFFCLIMQIFIVQYGYLNYNTEHGKVFYLSIRVSVFNMRLCGGGADVWTRVWVC